MGEDLKTEIIQRFHQYFPGNNDGIRVFFAPGRVNLIGEHTDYNGGFVLPTTLSLGTYMLARARHDGQFQMRSANFGDRLVTFSSNEMTFRQEDDWGNYPKGVVKELLAEGYPIEGGADLYFWGDLPNGAGLSSSASIGMVTAYGLVRLAGLEPSLKSLALLTQRMENHFIGVNTGIMDQFAVGFGKKDAALFLNCDTLDFVRIPLALGAYRLVVTHTNKPRGLAVSKYNERRAECEKALTILQEAKPEWRHLSDIDPQSFDDLKPMINDSLLSARVEHVVTENERVKKAVKALNAGDLPKFGELMKASHRSLRDLYEVTGQELDALYNVQKDIPGCLGTRMTGAGFGGCTISLVKEDQIKAFIANVGNKYKKITGLEASFYVSETGDGVKEIVEGASA